MSDRSFRNPRGQGKKRDRARDMEESTPFQQDRHALVLEQTVHDLRELAVDSFSDEASVKTVRDVVEEAFKIFDSTCSDFNFRPEPACKKGCAHCCHDQVEVTPVEAAYIGFYILENFSDAEIKKLVQRVDGFLKAKSSSSRAVSQENNSCLFLNDGLCRIYAARPFACRGRNSLDEFDCRMSLKENNTFVPVESHSLIVELAESIQDGILRGTKNLGLEAGYLSLPKALKVMLREGVAESVNLWLEGDFFFARAKGL